MYALRRTIHQSWLLACFCFGVVFGVIVSFWLPGLWFLSAAWVLLGGVLALTALSRRRVYALAIMLAAGGLVGLWRGDVYRQQLEPYEALIGKVVTLQGRVTEDSDTGERGDVVLRLSEIVVMEHEIAGNIWISTGDMAKIK